MNAADLRAADFKSEAAIMACPILQGSPYHTGRILDQFRRANPPAPPSQPKPSATDRAQFKAIANSLSTADAEWKGLEAKEQSYRATIGADMEQIRAMENALTPDADRAALLDLVCARVRVEVKQSFLSNLEPNRRGLGQRILGALHALNGLLEQGNLSTKKFYLAGISPGGSIRAALDCIETILKS